jgi:TetR/AcrR family transcriptional regulator
LRDDINDRLEKLFNEAAADHGNMKNREKAYSRTFLGVVNAWALLVINREIELNDATLNRVVHQFMHGIFS